MSVSTQERVFQAADELLAQGVKPSQQLIREKIGRGSATTIHRALNEWWHNLGRRLVRHEEDSGDIPAPVRLAFIELWQIACKQANLLQKQQNDAISASANSERQALQDEKNRFIERAEKLSEQLSTAYERIDKLQEELQSQQKLYLNQEKQLYMKSAELDKVSSDNKVLEKVIKELEERLKVS